MGTLRATNIQHADAASPNIVLAADGTATAPTAAALTNTTQLATTAFATTADNLKADLASPTFTGVPAAPTAAALTSTTQLATTEFVTAGIAALVAHSTDTTSVHGIADTSELETQTGAQAKADMAQSSAQSYADGLASNYDIAGAAATTQSSASSALSTHNSDTTSVHGISDTSLIATMSYADSAASSAVAALVDSAPVTLDTLNELAAALGDDPNFATTVATQIGNKADSSSVSSHTGATTSVHGIADTSELETQTGAQAKADMAQSSAQSYADGLASNYDIAGAAATTQSSASSALSTHNSDTTSVHGISDTSLIATMSYADSAASSAVAALVDSAPVTLDTLNELAAALGDDPNFATTVATQIGNKADSSSVSSHTGATTSVHGITDTSLLVYTADSRLSDQRVPTDGSVTSAKIVDGAILNIDINAAAAIVDTKLATISTASKVSNSATTATSANTASSIVSRDASGNFVAGTITAAITGTASGNLVSGGALGTPSSGAADNMTSNTETAGNSSTQIATTEFVTTADNLKANLASPTFTGTTNVASPTDVVSNGVRQITMSTAEPTGGSDGDVWLVYV